MTPALTWIQLIEQATLTALEEVIGCPFSDEQKNRLWTSVRDQTFNIGPGLVLGWETRF